MNRSLNMAAKLVLVSFVLGWTSPYLNAQQNSPSKQDAPGWASSWMQPHTEQQRKSQAYAKRCDELVKAEKYSEALALCNQAFNDFPDDMKPYGRRAGVLIKLQRLAAAAQDIDQGYQLAVQRKDPTSESVFLRLRGEVFSRQRNYPAAAENFRKAVHLAPDDPGNLNALGWLRATCPVPALRNGHEGVKFAQKALTLNPTHPYAVLDTLAAAYAESNDYARAVESEKRAFADAQKEASKDPFAAKFLITTNTRLQLFEQNQPYHHDTFED